MASGKDKNNPPHNEADENDDTKTLAYESDPTLMMYDPSLGTFGPETTTLSNGNDGLQRDSQHTFPVGDDSSYRQVLYNENRFALGRSIVQTVGLLNELSNENKQRPINFPTLLIHAGNAALNSPRSHIALERKNSELNGALSKTDSGLHEQENAFKVLNLNLKMGHSNKVISSLDQKSVTAFLDEKLVQQVKYLVNLKERIDDTSSKVLVTGDLNAGKSTFCNALLQRHILPEDQQPCTSVFCEVIDAKRENNGVEEVHAVALEKTYDRSDDSTYETRSLKDLEQLVYESDKYSLLKIYVLDKRTAERSLLGNNIIDVSLIDAPGLNMDSYQTTQVFSRQEEIDLVVFVVNSENHFTLSAKEFIAAAAAEKRYVFIVVNKFDNIRDKEKCSNRILDQVKSLSPDTWKDAKEFVHFVSSSDRISLFPNGGGPDDGPGDGPEFPEDPDFDHLEDSLRKFLLHKRSISKLLPAKNYLLNILGDLEKLSDYNKAIWTTEREEKAAVLRDLVAPKVNLMVLESLRASDKLNKLIEKACTKIYDATRAEIFDTLDSFGTGQVVPYYGLLNVYAYAKETQRRMIDTVLSAVKKSEEQARLDTQESVQSIVAYGKATLGDEFLANKTFKSDLMFTRRRDTLGNVFNEQIDVADFFDPSYESVLLSIGIPQSCVDLSVHQLSVLSPVHLLTNMPTSVANLKLLLPTQLTLQTLYSSTKIFTVGALIRRAYYFSSWFKQAIVPISVAIGGFALYYLINDIPNAYPRKQARKLKKRLRDIDYAHSSADRIAKESRQVLNYPSRQVMNCFQTGIDKRTGEKAELERQVKDADLSCAFFLNILWKIQAQQRTIAAIDLEYTLLVD